MSAYTTVNEQFDRAPKRRVLRGDKNLKLEPATHIIEFPGGAIELSRLDDGSYWAHIIVNRAQALPDLAPSMGSAFGRVVDSRIDWDDRREVAIPSLPDGAYLTQIAVRIVPEVTA